MLRLESNPYFFPNIDTILTQPLPARDFPWTIISHPITTQSSLGRIYTRDNITHEVYVQHYIVTPQPIDTYQLKFTKRNANSKGTTKYTCTMDTSAIIKCQGCQLHNDQHLTDALRIANRNNRTSPTCIFKQDLKLAQLLLIKSHQLY